MWRLTLTRDLPSKFMFLIRLHESQLVDVNVTVIKNKKLCMLTVYIYAVCVCVYIYIYIAAHRSLLFAACIVICKHQDAHSH